MKKNQLLSGLLLLAVFLIIGGCSIEKPEAPSWETTWDLPLTNKTYTIEDIVDKLDTDQIIFDSLGNPSFSIIQDVDTVSVEDNLTTDAVSQSYDDSLGVIDIEEPAIQPVQYLFDDLNLPVTIDQIPVDTAFTQTDNLSIIDNFDWAVISQGIIELQVFNDLGIDIDSLVITLYNTSDMVTPIGSAIFENGILDNQTLSRQINLAGRYVENALTVRSHGVVLAQGIDLPSNEMTIDASFPSGISVSSAYAEIPSYSHDIDQVIDLNEQSIIYEATIGNGTIDLQIVNGSSVPMDINLSIPNFTYYSTPLTITDHILGHGTLNRFIDLADYSFVPSGSSAPQSIDVNVQATISDTSPVKYQISSSDSVSVSADVSQITFASVTGQIEPTEITIDPMTQQVDLPQGFENARLTQAELRMTLYNSSTTDVYIDLLLENQDGSENVVVQDTIRGKTSLIAEPRETEIIITAFSLGDFLDPMPEEIQISGSAILNPANHDSVQINRDDFFYGQVQIYSPLAFALADTADIDLEITEAEITGEDTPDFEETFNYGLIHAEFASHLPVGAIIELYIGTMNGDGIYTDPNSLVIGPFTLESASTDVDGFAIDEVISVFGDSLTSTEISIFDNDLVYIAPRVALLPTGSNGSIIQGSDYINISAIARIQIHAGNNLWDDNNGN